LVGSLQSSLLSTRTKNISKVRALHSFIQGQALTGFDKIISISRGW
jgi:hypothetical protein